MDIRFDIIVNLYMRFIGDAVLHLSILQVFMVIRLTTAMAMSLLAEGLKVYAKLSDARPFHVLKVFVTWTPSIYLCVNNIFRISIILALALETHEH